MVEILVDGTSLSVTVAWLCGSCMRVHGVARWTGESPRGTCESCTRAPGEDGVLYLANGPDTHRGDPSA